MYNCFESGKCLLVETNICLKCSEDVQFGYVHIAAFTERLFATAFERVGRDGDDGCQGGDAGVVSRPCNPTRCNPKEGRGLFLSIHLNVAAMQFCHIFRRDLIWLAQA